MICPDCRGNADWTAGRLVHDVMSEAPHPRNGHERCRERNKDLAPGQSTPDCTCQHGDRGEYRPVRA